jgi:hypothetical protein
MFARRVIMQLKPNSVGDFTKTLDKEIIPLLRRQNGFHDEITFVVPGKVEAFGISLWDKSESAEAYGRKVYPEVLKMLAKVIEGTPKVETYEVATSTFHNIPAPVAA